MVFSWKQWVSLVLAGLILLAGRFNAAHSGGDALSPGESSIISEADPAVLQLRSVLSADNRGALAVNDQPPPQSTPGNDLLPQNGAEACGMDGFRMAISRGNVETNESFTALVPVTSAKLVQKVIGDREDVSFRFGKGVMIAEAYDTAIEVSMLAGEYIDYPLMLPKEHTLRLKVKTEELLNATQIAMVSASEGKKDMIVLKIIDEDTIQVIAMADRSGAVTAVNCMVEGSLTNKDGLSDGNEIAFNGRYIEDCLKAQMAYSEESIIELKSRVSPMVVLPVGREDFYQLVLPVRRT